MTGTLAGRAERQDRRLALVLRAVAVCGLLVSAVVHLRLAPVFDQLGTSITQGQLFRLEAAAALVAAVLLVVSDRRVVWAVAGLVAASGLVAVLVTRYVELPAIGPLPSTYDPSWSSDALVVAVSTAAATGAWAARLVSRARARAGRPERRQTA